MSSELEKVLQIIQGGEKSSTKSLNNQWQKQMLGWVYASALESSIMTWLSSDDMSKQEFIKTLMTIIQNKPTDQSDSITEQVMQQLDRHLNN
tara:strand:+ start:666 stop:941 length:276 start_codon:yes stop_codon:yes gene_type:complete